MKSNHETIYSDVPVPRREDLKRPRPGFTQLGPAEMSHSQLGSPEMSQAGSSENRQASLSKPTGGGRSPWNYITEEDLLARCPEDLTARRKKEEEKYKAWKEQVRQGRTPEEPYAIRVRYARRWASELLSGSFSPAEHRPLTKEEKEEGWQILGRFGEELADGFTLSGYLPETLAEIRKYYVIMNDLPRSYVAQAFAGDIAKDERYLALIDYREAAEQQPKLLSQAIFDIGKYRADKSHFIDAYEEDMTACVCRVYSAWADSYAQDHEKSLASELLGEMDKRVWYPYETLHTNIPAMGGNVSFTWQPDPALVYICRRGKWTISQYFPGIFGNRILKEETGDLCRETERLLREAAGFRRLKPADMDEDLKKLVRQEVLGYLKEKKEAARPRIQLDLGKLDDIRSDADYTRDQLLQGTEDELAELEQTFRQPALHSTESAQIVQQAEEGKAEPSQIAQRAEERTTEPNAESLRSDQGEDRREEIQEEKNGDTTAGMPQEPEPEPSAAAGSAGEGGPGRLADSPWASYSLSPDEAQVLNMLLGREDPSAYIQSHRLFASIVADSINDKLFDQIGDSVIEESDGSLSLIEDYMEELLQLQ